MRSPVALYTVVAVLIFLICFPETARAAETPAAAEALCSDENDPERAETPPRTSKPVPVEPAPLPPPLAEDEKLFDAESYRDVYKILRDENPCSRFFGGSAKALEAFNRFAGKLERKPLGDERIVLQMDGRYTRFSNAETGATYRIFDRAAINSEGPFFRRTQTAGKMRLLVGKYPAHTRQARALVLLHELGHLVTDERGAWLLPNDGNNAEQSERNTRKVEDKCFREIKALRE